MLPTLPAVISFKPTDDQQMVAELVREFSRSRLRPSSAHVEHEGVEMDSMLEDLGRLGLIQSMAEAAVEGEDLYPRILSAMVLEELGWADANTAHAFAATAGFVRAVAEHGSPRQRQEILPEYAATGCTHAGILATELGLMFDIDKTTTSISPCDDGTWRLQGVKTLVPLADACRHFLVVARDADRLTAVIVDAGATGVTLGPERETMGLTAQRFRDVEFDLPISKDQILGEDEGGPVDVQALVDGARVASSAILTGLCRAVHEHSIEYTKAREAHGSVLARKQVVALRLVDMLIDVEAMRWMTWRAATHLDKRAGGTRSAKLAHVFATKKSNWIADEGVQFMGGHGFIAENPVEAWYRNAKTLATLQLTTGA